MNKTLLPSIFNDVIGPVMRGPSSSHCAAGLRIGNMARDLVGGRFDKILIEFDPKGSLATTHESQGSDLGLFGGILGFQADDKRLLQAHEILAEAGITVEIAIRDIGTKHPNTYKLTLYRDKNEFSLTANSLGGGMIEVIEINGFAVSLYGDSFVTLLELEKGEEHKCIKEIDSSFETDCLRHHQKGEKTLVEVSAQSFIPADIEEKLCDLLKVIQIFRINPVLPVLSNRNMSVPFKSVEEMLSKGNSENAMSNFALAYECERSCLSSEKVLEKMVSINRIIKKSIDQGLKGTTFEDRILGYQSGKFCKMQKQGKLLDGGLLNHIIKYCTVLMEIKSSMGVIVAAPTAGSCATCPGACLATAEMLKSSEEAAARAMLTAGLIGVFAAFKTSFAAEVGGCQAETGVGSAMAAAALVELAGGSTKQSLAAASISLQNVLGLVCDPIANRVEAPCLGRNIAGAANALSSANMALADFDPLIPFDQVLDAHREISKRIPRELRCTALGGLSVTPKSREIEKQLKDSMRKNNPLK